MYNEDIYKDILASDNFVQLLYLMSVILDEAGDKVANARPSEEVYEEIDKVMEVGKKIMSIRPWNNPDTPPNEGDDIEVMWCNQPSKGYYEDGMFKVDAWIPVGFGFSGEGTPYKKVVNATAWRKR